MIDLAQIRSILKETDAIFFDQALRADVKKKGDADFVTRADCEISEYLHKRLSQAFPNIGFISEEGETEIDATKDYWILDPVDGTTNFMHGISCCAVSLGLYADGDFAAGVIYLPYTDEMIWAQKGMGAYRNGERICCSGHGQLSDCLALMEYNAYFKNDHPAALEQAKRIFLACQDIRTLGSAAAELAYIALGVADVFLGRYLKPWDYAAAVCIIREAGGVLGALDGELRVDRFNQHVIASNAAVFDQVLALLKEK